MLDCRLYTIVNDVHRVTVKGIESTMSSLPPQEYPRRVMLFVTGTNTQVVTTTLYALAFLQDPPFLPTEIHLITTQVGADYALTTLFNGSAKSDENATTMDGAGWLSRFYEDYPKLPKPKMGEGFIEVMQDTQGQPIEDVQTEEQNTACMNALMNSLRRFISDDDCALHASIAGGRKTMGFYLGYGMSMLGRDQDRLSHVLVPAEYEFNQAFYYPSPVPKTIFRQQPPMHTLDAHNVDIKLADIPFVRMRDRLPMALLTDLLDQQTPYPETVELLQNSYDQPSIHINLGTQTLDVGQQKVLLSTVNLAFYYWMAKRKKEELPPISRHDESVIDDYLLAYEEIAGRENSAYQRALQALSPKKAVKVLGGNMVTTAAATEFGVYFDSRKSYVNKALIEALGPDRAKPYLISPQGQRPRTVFGLTLPPQYIQLINRRE